ncbi:MAG: PAS domain S-box protein [Bacteroidetes bacterium]|nr:PAS domain S-box protein [Bacteroidota bacterium]
MKTKSDIRKETAPAQTEIQLSDIIDFLPNATLAIDNEKRIIIWNKAIANMTGIPAEQMIGKGGYAYTIPFYGEARPQLMDMVFLDSDEIALHYPNIIREGNTFITEVFCNALYDNKGAWVFAKASPLHDQSGNIIGAIESIRDITESKLAEISLAESEKKFRTIAEQTSDLIAITDAAGCITYASSASRTLFACEPSEMCGRLFMEFLSENDIPKAMEAFRRTIELGSEVKNIELTMKRKDDSLFIGELTASNFHSGRENGSLVTIHDITERKQTEQEVQKIAQHYQAIIEKAPDGFVLLSKEGTFKYISPAAKKMFGFDASADLTMNPAEHTHPDDLHMVLSDLTKIIEDPAYIPTLQYRYQDAIGNWRWIESTMSNLLSDPSVESLVINFRDIHERKLAENEIILLNKELDQRVKQRTAELEASNRELESFSYSVSHDLKAPLRHIRGFIDLVLENETTGLTEEKIGFLKTISHSATDMGQLIDAILSFSRLSQAPLRKTLIHSSDMVKEVVNFFGTEIQNRKINFNIDSLPDIHGDEELIRQVWTNLISNAIKYTGKKPEATIEIGSKESNTGTTFHIRDNGAGFNMKYAEKLFRVFQRLHKSRDFEGIGIGLANVNRIVSRHGGQCQAEGEPEKGATFYFTIPN